MDEFAHDKIARINSLKAGAAGLMGRWQSSVSVAGPPNDELSRSPWSVRAGSNALQERLDEVLVLELMKDGGRRYLHLSVRSLYKHVMAVITNLNTIPVVPSEPPSSPPSAKIPPPISLSTVPEEGPTVSGDHSSADKSANDSSEDKTQDRHPENQEEESPAAKEDQTPAEKKEGGNVSVTSVDVEVSYRERLGGYLHPRDMRKLVMPFSAMNEPELMVRRHAILLNFDPLRCIILRDRLLLLVPEGADSILVDVERRVRGGHKELERVIFGSETNSTTPESLVDMVGDSVRSSGAVAASPKEPKKSMVNRLWNLVSLTGSQSSGGDDDQGSGSHHSSKKGRNSKSKQANMPEESWEDFGGDTIIENEETMEDVPPPVEVELADIAGQEWVELPFELQCTDAVLQTVVSLLSDETYELQEASMSFINEVIHGKRGNTYISEDPLAMIRAIKDSVREMMARVKRFVESMNGILDDEERMALMNLSRLITHPERFMIPVPPEVLQEESDEPELIMEACLQQSLSLANVIHLIQGQINTAAELVDQKLDATRNKILLANTIITTAAFTGNFLVTIAGLFGMNVINHLEDSETAWMRITCWSLAGSVLAFFAIMYILYRTGTIPNWGGLSKGF